MDLKQNPMYRFLVVLTIASTAGLQAWLTLFNNFAVEAVNLDGQHIGIIQSIREIPGFLALFAIFAMMVIREHRLSTLSIMIMGLGLAGTGFLPSFGGLIFTTLVMSFGFHYFETTNQSLTLQYFDNTQSPLVFGRLRSLAAASSIGVGILIYLASFILNYTQCYLLIGGLVALAGIWGSFRDPSSRDIVPQRRSMVIRKKYWLFYFLTFMAGARRQIFMAFAVFLMVKRFHFQIQEITALFVLNNCVNYFLSPIIGKSILRFGERRILTLEYGALVLIFLAYATVHSRLLLALLYVLDHVFFNFSMAIRTYFQKVADPRDIAPSMAVGFTINHIAAVVLPALGGLLWMIDYRIPFFAGAFMCLISLAAVRKVPPKRRS